MDIAYEDVSYERLAGSLGSLLLIWARVERLIKKEVDDAGLRLPRTAGIDRMLRAWEKSVATRSADGLNASLAKKLCAELRKRLQVRNGLCHGLCGILCGDGGSPAKLIWEHRGKTHEVSWEELQTSFGWLSRVDRAIPMISTLVSGRPGDRLVDSAENREWWRLEFGI